MKIFTSIFAVMAMALPMAAAEPGTVISEQPDGLGTEYDMHYSGFYYGLNGFEFVEDQVLTTTIVKGDDGCVYFEDMFAFMPAGTWVKGDVDADGVITVKLPQTIGGGVSDKYGRSWQDLEVFYSADAENELPVPVTNPEQNCLTFITQEDGSIIMQELGEGYALSVNDYSSDYPDGMWMGMSLTSITYQELSGDYSLITPPENLQTKRYSYITRGMGTDKNDPADFGYRITIGFDGDDVYIGGISLDIPQIWVKGRREGNRIILPNNQPMGSMGGVYKVMLQYCEKNPKAYGGYSLMPNETEFVFIYDEATDTFSTEDPSVIILVNGGGADKINYLQMITDPTLIYQPEAKGTPMAPWGMTFYRRGGGQNFDTLDFNLPLISTDGVLLERENMYYRLFIDGEHFEILDIDFDSGVDMWDIPYNFDRYLIVCNRMNTAHEMGIRIDGYDTLGIQSINIWDGVEYASEIVTLDTNGVKEIDGVTQSEVVTEEYYTLDGQRMFRPVSGICLKHVVRVDGTVEVTKHIVR